MSFVYICQQCFVWTIDKNSYYDLNDILLKVMKYVQHEFRFAAMLTTLTGFAAVTIALAQDQTPCMEKFYEQPQFFGRYSGSLLAHDEKRERWEAYDPEGNDNGAVVRCTIADARYWRMRFSSAYLGINELLGVCAPVECDHNEITPYTIHMYSMLLDRSTLERQSILKSYSIFAHSMILPAFYRYSEMFEYLTTLLRDALVGNALILETAITFLPLLAFIFFFLLSWLVGNFGTPTLIKVPRKLSGALPILLMGHVVVETAIGGNWRWPRFWQEYAQMDSGHARDAFAYVWSTVAGAVVAHSVLVRHCGGEAAAFSFSNVLRGLVGVILHVWRLSLAVLFTISCWFLITVSGPPNVADFAAARPNSAEGMINNLVNDLHHFEPFQLRRVVESLQNIFVIAALIVISKSLPTRLRVGLAPVWFVIFRDHGGPVAIILAEWFDWLYIPVEWSLIPAFFYGCEDWQDYANNSLVIVWVCVYAVGSIILRRWVGWLDRYSITAYYSVPVCVYAIWHFVHLGHEELSAYNLYSHAVGVSVLVLLVAWATNAPAQTITGRDQ